MFDWIYFLAPNLKQLGGELLTCLGQTFTMIGVSGILSWILGILVGVLLVTCRPGGILERIGRSLRFLTAGSTSSARFHSLS